MSLINPTALIWAALAVPVVIFYLLKVRLRRVSVATMMFWDQEADEQKRPASIWRKLRNLASLLLQLLMLGLMLFALVNPSLTSPERQRRIVLVLDNSASMQTIDSSGNSRLQLANQQAEQIVASLRPDEELAIIVCGNRPTVACGLTSQTTQLRRTLAAISATDSPAQLLSAIRLSRQLIADHPESEVIVLTDQARIETIESNVDDTLWSVVGSDAGNVAITECQVRRSSRDGMAWQLWVEVANWNSTSVDITLQVMLDDVLLDVIPLSMGAEDVHHEIFENTSMEGGVLSVQLKSDTNEPLDIGVNALEVDDVAHAVLSTRRKIPVTLVSSGRNNSWFLQRVLEANDLVDLSIVSDIPNQFASDGVLILQGDVPAEVPSGQVFVVDPQASTDLWKRVGELEAPLVDQQESSDDLVRYVRLDNVQMPNAVELRPLAEHDVLIKAISGAPLYTRFSRPGGDVLVLSVGLSEGDLPLRTAFPILLSNAFQWLSSDSREFSPAIRTGTAARVPVANRLTNEPVSGITGNSLILTSPAGNNMRVSVRDGDAVIPPLPTVGVWAMHPPDTDRSLSVERPDQETLLACNLCDRLESDVRQSSTRPRVDLNTAGFTGHPIWLYLIACAALLLVVEWGLFQRRWME